LNDRLGRLEQRLQAAPPADLAERVKRLEERPAQPSVPPEITQRLAQTEQRAQANAEAAGAMQWLQGELQALQQRLTEFERRERAEAAHDRTDQALLLALTQLRQAAQTARPFASELGAATALAKERSEIAAELQKLERVAAKGVPTVPLLAQKFDKILGEVVRREQVPASEHWADQILDRLRSLVTVRRIGKSGVEGGVDAAVANAEQSLAEGDLANAVAALETLQGAPADAARPWLEEARARLAVDAALATAGNKVLALAAQDGKS